MALDKLQPEEDTIDWPRFHMHGIHTYTHTFVTLQATKFIRPWQMAASSDRKALGTVIAGRKRFWR